MNNNPCRDWSAKSATLALIGATLLAAPSLACAYNVVTNPNNIAPTAETAPPTTPPTVYLSPTNVSGHPCTLWAPQDISNYKAALATNPMLQSDYNTLVSQLNKRLSLAATSTGTCTYNLWGGSAQITPAPGVTVSYTAQGVPIAQTSLSGTAVYLGDATDVSGDNGSVMTEMGMMYALTGSQQYGEFVRQSLVSYASYYGQYGHPLVNGVPWTPANYRSAIDGRLSYQFLNDAFFLCNIAFAYDLINDGKLTTLTSSDQTNIRNFFEAICAEFTNSNVGTPDYLSQGHNRSCLSAAGTLMAGYASDDSTLINEALYGTGGSATNPIGGITVVHLGLVHPTAPGSLVSNMSPDGLWIESSIGYQTSIAGCGVLDAAIMMEHHGINAFGPDDQGHYPIKRFLDSALYIAYPDDGQMLCPNLGNTAPIALLSNLNYASNECGELYWYGYQYYQDPKYLPIMRNQVQELSMTSHNGPPSLFLTAPVSPWTVTQSAMDAAIPTVSGTVDAFTWLQSNKSYSYFDETFGTEGDPMLLSSSMISALGTSPYASESGTIVSILDSAFDNEPAPPVNSANFFSNGYGVQRLAGTSGVNQLLVEYGSNLASHGQPASLSLDLHALGGTLLTLPGDIFPYNSPLDPQWYWQTFANNTVTVDGTLQIYGGNYWNFPKSEEKPFTAQDVFGSAQTMGIQKVSSTGTNSVYAQFGVTQDRAVFTTPNYTADLFLNTSSTTHTYDLVWHPVGTVTTSLSESPMTWSQFSSPAPGYLSMTVSGTGTSPSFTNLQQAPPPGRGMPRSPRPTVEWPGFLPRPIHRCK
jgi:hypothetical protein